MLITLSPAKTLNFETVPNVSRHTKPLMLDEAESLVRIMRRKKRTEIKNLMNVSEKIADLNIERFKKWSKTNSNSVKKQAIYAFMGDVYTGLEAHTLNPKDIEFAQIYLRILSGLYGVLRPLDSLQAYRLEMGLKLTTPKGLNLYQYWGDQITLILNKHAKSSNSECLLNLASGEYFKAVNKNKLDLK